MKAIVFLTNHETRDVLKEKERDPALSAQFDKVGSLNRNKHNKQDTRCVRRTKALVGKIIATKVVFRCGKQQGKRRMHYLGRETDGGFIFSHRQKPKGTYRVHFYKNG